MQPTLEPTGNLYLSFYLKQYVCYNTFFQTLVTIGNSVPTTLVNHSSSPDSTPGPEDVLTTMNTPGQETGLRDSSAPVMNNAAMNNIPEPAIVNVATLSSVSLKRPRQERRFIPLVNCSKCSKEIRGKCSSCLIKELKSIIYEKDKEIKELKSKDKIQVKTIARKDNKIISLKDRIKQYRKKLNTSAHRIARMRQCARVCFCYSSIESIYN